MTPAEYRDRFNHPSETPLAGVAYSQQCLREDIWRRQPLWPRTTRPIMNINSSSLKPISNTNYTCSL
ncbi:hypothetical protein CRN15_29525 (plasmid) [Raoultella planticola]|uniref:Uncharacterized protein n=1 Tax=Raoultella planticola TaxID=575 RepID=A0A291VN94_RAOPL|nr:hypothetical protein CRN15_29525 [Raoultella planticola]